MDLIKAENIKLNTGTKDILIKESFCILENRHYGLIGSNGTGKTTLLRLLLGELIPESGIIKKKKKLKISYVPQNPEYSAEDSVENYLLLETTLIQKKMRSLEEKMSRESKKEMNKLLFEYQSLSDKFEENGGYNALDRGQVFLGKLGFNNPLQQKLCSLSGGERSLVFFAKALINEPDLLILDEPGNHLDYLGLAWLEAFLANHAGTFLLVSHNRYLLDKSCTNIWNLAGGKLDTYTGNYSSYKTERIRVAIIEQSEYESAQKEAASLRKRENQLQSIARSQYNPPPRILAELAAVKRKLKQAEKKLTEKPNLGQQNIRVDFGDGKSKSRFAMKIKNLNIAFGDKLIFSDAGMEIFCREKVAILGPNGSGKTTLINTILKHGDWNDENIRIGPDQRIGYLSQVPSFHRDALTIEDEIRSWGALSISDAFDLVKSFGFKYWDMGKRLKVLSGGERNKLQFAHLIYKKINFLILDEPTNHMDINSREVIEEAVARFSGTVLVVSHDRYFMDGLVDRIIEIDNKKLVSFPGDFSCYFKKKYPVLPKLSGGIDKRRRESSFKKNTANLQKSDSPGSLCKKDISINPGVLQKLKQIEEAESEKKILEDDLETAFRKNNHQIGRRISTKLEKLNKRIEKFYKEWENLDK